MAESYTEDQLVRYLEHISYPRSQHASDKLRLLAELQAHHIARVPFESIGLHYSRHRLLSLELDDLFDKIVVGGKGGYCMEVNALFNAMLRALEFDVLSIGARVKLGPRYTGMLTHCANIVTIDDVRYLVDVGFSTYTIFHPVPLTDGIEFANVRPRRGKLEFRPLAQSTSPSTQSLWIYSSQETSSADWIERYCFNEMEIFAADLAVGNFYVSRNPTSFCAKHVLASRGILNDRGDGIAGFLTIFRGEVKRRMEDGVKSEVVERIKNEEERLKALETWFMISLTEKEATAIRGFPSELRESLGAAAAMF